MRFFNLVISSLAAIAAASPNSLATRNSELLAVNNAEVAETI